MWDLITGFWLRKTRRIHYRSWVEKKQRANVWKILETKPLKPWGSDSWEIKRYCHRPRIRFQIDAGVAGRKRPLQWDLPEKTEKFLREGCCWWEVYEINEKALPNRGTCFPQKNHSDIHDLVKTRPSPRRSQRRRYSASPSTCSPKKWFCCPCFCRPFPRPRRLFGNWTCSGVSMSAVHNFTTSQLHNLTT